MGVCAVRYFNRTAPDTAKSGGVTLGVCAVRSGQSHGADPQCHVTWHPQFLYGLPYVFQSRQNVCMPWCSRVVRMCVPVRNTATVTHSLPRKTINMMFAKAQPCRLPSMAWIGVDRSENPLQGFWSCDRRSVRPGAEHRNWDAQSGS